MEKPEIKIQIVAFSTNDTYETPNDFINVFLSNNKHTIQKQGKNSLAFSLTNISVNATLKVMICSILNLQRDYPGIQDVNCYLLFVDLEKETSPQKFDEILLYMKNNCDQCKKVFIFALSSNNEKQFITQGDITDKLDREGKDYVIKSTSIDKLQEINDYFLTILTFSAKHKKDEEFDTNAEEKNGSESNSCFIY